MGSFYGSSSAGRIGSAITFDKIYHSRKTMDQAADTDGVFLGRYVLVDYDDPPIVLYFDESTGQIRAYRDAKREYEVLARNCQENKLYIDGYGINSVKFYTISNGGFLPVQTDAISGYQANHSIDNEYGRGYDSTVWMKTYDTNENKYHYVMIAELNSVTPNFHLMVEKPTEVPTTPYFDRDTTKLNYYLHLAPPFGSRIKTATISGKVANDATASILSDESVTYEKVTYDSTKEPGYSTSPVTVNADIYFNKRGFNRVHHALTPVGADGAPLLNDTINYNLVESGRLYRDEQSPDLTDTKTAKDTYEWYINLPSIGDAVCQVWDFMYGYDPSEYYRYTQIAQSRADDSFSQLDDTTYKCGVSYNDETMIGMLNTLRDIKGYSDVLTIGSVKNKNLTNAAQINSQSKKLYATTTKKVNGIDVPTTYGCYVPDYRYVKTNTYNPNETYYELLGNDENNEMRQRFARVNGSLIEAKDANGNYVDGRTGTTPTKNYYTRIADAYYGVELETPVDDTLYGWFVRAHQLLGTGLTDTRNPNTVLGAINCMKDLFTTIDSNIAPGRLLVSNPSTGRIEASNTYFPGPASHSGYVLSQEGNWVCRLRSMTLNGKTILPDANSNVALSSANEWIIMDSNTAAISWEHKTVNNVIYTPTAVSKKSIGLDAGGSISLFSAGSIDQAGHVINPTNTVIYLPQLTFSTASSKGTANTDGSMLVGASITHTAGNGNAASVTNIEWQWAYVSEQKLVNYSVKANDGILAVTDTVNTAFSKIEAAHLSLVNTVATNKTAIEQSLADAIQANNEEHETISGAISDLDSSNTQEHTSIEQSITALEEELQDITEQNEQAHQDLGESIATNISALRAAIYGDGETTQGTIGELNEAIDTVAEDFNTALTEAVDGLNETIETMGSEIETLNSIATGVANNYIIIYNNNDSHLYVVDIVNKTALGADKASYQWYANDVAIENATAPSLDLKNRNDGIPYNYRCQYTIDNITYGTATLTIVIAAPELPEEPEEPTE